MEDNILNEIIEKISELPLKKQQEIVSELYNEIYNKCRIAYIESQQRMEQNEAVLQTFPYKPPNSQFNIDSSLNKNKPTR